MTKMLNVSNKISPEDRDLLLKKVEALLIRSSRVSVRVQNLGRTDMYWQGVSDALSDVWKLIEETTDDYCFFDEDEDLLTDDISEDNEY